MTTVKASFALGSRTWTFHREIRHAAAARAVLAVALAVALLTSAAAALALLPVHLALRAAGKPGILEATLQR